MPLLQLTHVSIDRTLTAEKSAHKIRILVPGHETAEAIYRPGLLERYTAAWCEKHLSPLESLRR